MIPPVEEINAYIRTLADLLGLKDWHLEYDGTLSGCDDNVLGECYSAPNRKNGTVKFQDRIFDYSLTAQREAFVHELIHMHTRDARNVGRDILYDGRILPHATYFVFFRALDNALEQAVDGIAVAVAEYMPLPPWSATNDERTQR